MAPMGTNRDEWIADIGSYVRNSFGNVGTFISQADVARVRAATAGRTAFWKVDELVASLPAALEPAAAWKVTASHNADAASGAMSFAGWSTGTPQQPGMWFQIELPDAATISEIQFVSPGGGRGGGGRGRGGRGGRGAAGAGAPGGTAAPAGAAARGLSCADRQRPRHRLPAQSETTRVHTKSTCRPTARRGSPSLKARARRDRRRSPSLRSRRASFESLRQGRSRTLRRGRCSGCGCLPPGSRRARLSSVFGGICTPVHAGRCAMQTGVLQCEVEIDLN